MGIQAFFNEPTMFVHLHVPPMHYMFCSDDVANGYQMNPNASEWIYPLLIKQGLRVWVYSGDVDANVPITGTINWVTRMKENEGFPVE